VKLTPSKLYTVTFSGEIDGHLVKGMVNIMAIDLMDLAMFIKQGVQETMLHEMTVDEEGQPVNDSGIPEQREITDFEIMSIECRGRSYVTPDVIMTVTGMAH